MNQSHHPSDRDLRVTLGRTSIAFKGLAMTRLAQKFNLTRLLAVFFCLGVIGQASSAWAGFKPKRGIGRSKQRIGLASRGGCAVAPDSKPLTAIVPMASGFTAKQQPDFTWFMPKHSYPSTEFRLIAESEAGLEIVHRKVFNTLPQNQVVSYNFASESVAPLEVGKAYKWQVHLVCDPDMPSGNIFAEGWVEYEAPSASLQQQLASATASQKPDLWLENGYWYEGVKELWTQTQNESSRDAALREWQSLMVDEQVNLPHLATFANDELE